MLKIKMRKVTYGTSLKSQNAILSATPRFPIPVTVFFSDRKRLFFHLFVAPQPQIKPDSK